MNLSHRFDKEEVNRVWVFSPYCADPDCESNNNCSVHHIYGAKGKWNDSICNGILLCQDCHRKADGQNIHEPGNKLRQRYLKLALKQIVKSGHVFTEKDQKFLASVEKDLKRVLH